MKKVYYLLFVPFFLFLFGYFYGHNSFGRIEKKFKKFIATNTGNIKKIEKISISFCEQNKNIESIIYSISTKNKDVAISMFDSTNKILKEININRDVFFGHLVLSPPSDILIYKKNKFILFKNVYKDFSSNTYSLIFFIDAQADSSFRSE